MTKPNPWKRVWTVGEATAFFGAGYVATLTAAACESRRVGAWDANDPERYGAYGAIGQHLGGRIVEADGQYT